jgi:hypothetical protein
MEIGVDNIIAKYGRMAVDITPPISEKRLCEAVEELKAIKIRCQASKKPAILEEGLLIPVRGGFIVQYGVLDRRGKPFPAVKIRETICHELAHILFYDCTLPIPKLMVMPPEHLCHTIARQLLVPDNILKKTFSELIGSGVNLVWLIRKLSAEFGVAHRVMAQRLTEDLSLLRDSMVTFWKHRNREDNLPLSPQLNQTLDLQDFYIDSRLCPELKSYLPPYWRNKVHLEVWNKVVSKAILGKEIIGESRIHIKGKRQDAGRLKNITFEVHYEPLSKYSRQLEFEWGEQTKPVYQFISAEKFDMASLA